MGGRLRMAIGAACAALAMSVAACDGTNAFGVTGAGGSGGATQLGTIEGQVTADGAGIGAVPVVLVGRDSVNTNGQGVFRFQSLAAGQYQVAVRVPIGFTLAPGQNATRTVSVSSGGTTTLTFDLDDTGGGTTP